MFIAITQSGVNIAASLFFVFALDRKVADGGFWTRSPPKGGAVGAGRGALPS